MTSVATTAPAVTTIDEALLDPRPDRRAVRRLVQRRRRELAAERAERAQLMAAYCGGLPGECDAAAKVRALGRARTKIARRDVRVIYLSRAGRRIDLLAMLALSRPDDSPAWTVADPANSDTGAYVYYCSAPGQGPGKRAWVSEVRAGAIAGQTIVVSPGKATIWTPTCRGPRSPGYLGRIYQPSGLPPLPQRVRDLATDTSIRRRARWVGVLYQPTAWEEVKRNPDPALVAEWTDRPGEYYALAVWGGDRACIMEFVD